MDIHQQKKELRRKIKAIKKEYSYSQKREMSISLCINIENLKAFQNSSTVMAYWSMEDEVNTHDFVKKYPAFTIHFYDMVQKTRESKEFAEVREKFYSTEWQPL